MKTDIKKLIEGSRFYDCDLKKGYDKEVAKFCKNLKYFEMEDFKKFLEDNSFNRRFQISLICKSELFLKEATYTPSLKVWEDKNNRYPILLNIARLFDEKELYKNKNILEFIKNSLIFLKMNVEDTIDNNIFRFKDNDKIRELRYSKNDIEEIIELFCKSENINVLLNVKLIKHLLFKFLSPKTFRILSENEKVSRYLLEDYLMWYPFNEQDSDKNISFCKCIYNSYSVFPSFEISEKKNFVSPSGRHMYVTQYKEYSLIISEYIKEYLLLRKRKDASEVFKNFFGDISSPFDIFSKEDKELQRIYSSEKFREL